MSVHIYVNIVTNTVDVATKDEALVITFIDAEGVIVHCVLAVHTQVA